MRYGPNKDHCLVLPTTLSTYVLLLLRDISLNPFLRHPSTGGQPLYSLKIDTQC